MGMKSFFMQAAMMAGLAASDNSMFMGEQVSRVEYNSPKLTGFTAAQGRKKLSKKKRKELNLKKRNNHN